MKTILAEKIILLAFMATACSVRAGAPVWFEAPELPEAPRLESGLKDPAWAKALRVPLEKSDGEIGRFTTESCWLYAGGSLFVGFKCANPDSPRLHAVPNVPRDQPIYTKESIELFLGSADGDLYYQLIVDAQGNVFDARTEKQKGGTGWDGEWKSAVSVEPGYWTLVFEIPAPLLETLGAPKSFVNMDATRHAFTPDGAQGVAASIFRAGNQNPRNPLLLGRVDPAMLGKELLQRAEALGGDGGPEIDRLLAAVRSFADGCNGVGTVPLAQYRPYFERFTALKQKIQCAREDQIFRVIFGPGPKR